MLSAPACPELEGEPRSAYGAALGADTLPVDRTEHEGNQVMTVLRSLRRRDFYLASNGNVHAWGGGLTVARGLGHGLEQCGSSSLLLGIDDSPHPAPELDPATPGLNLPSGVPRRLWRFRSWLVPRMLARSLRRLPPPHAAFIGLHPFWVLAAKRAWPDVPVVLAFAALLSNCLPFTWPRRRQSSLWARLDYAAIRWAERLAFEQADLTLVPTHQNVTEVRLFAPRSARRLERCAFGMEPLEISAELRARTRAQIGAGDDDFIIAAIGVCDRNKAFDLAVSAMPQIDPRGRLVIVGGGPEHEQLKLLADRLGVADRVTLVGPQQDMPPWYAAADCVLSTSWYDTFPNVLLEAMYVGRPIIAPRHDPPRVYSGLSEVVHEHGAGLLYKRSEVGNLAACVNLLMRDPTAATRLGTLGQKVVRTHHHWRVAAARIQAHCGITPNAEESVDTSADGRELRECVHVL